MGTDATNERRQPLQEGDESTSVNGTNKKKPNKNNKNIKRSGTRPPPSPLGGRQLPAWCDDDGGATKRTRKNRRASQTLSRDTTPPSAMIKSMSDTPTPTINN